MPEQDLEIGKVWNNGEEGKTYQKTSFNNKNEIQSPKNQSNTTLAN